MKKPTRKETDEFLRESNAIEGVYDEDSFRQAKLAWQFLMTKDVLTTGTIMKTHKILMLHQPLAPNEKGYYRQDEVMIARRYGLTWEKIPNAMDAWIQLVNYSILGKLPESDVRFHHVEYEKIHPFIDGNGRTGRMFMNWERIKVGLPILIIHEGKEQTEYYKWFNEEVKFKAPEFI